MNAIAQPWLPEAAREPQEQPAPERPRSAARRTPGARSRAAQHARRARLARAFIAFAVCLSLLAAGRVAISFAVVQKSLATDAVVQQQRRVSAENAQLAEDVAQLASTVRIRHIAETQLGLVDADHVLYLKAPKSAASKREVVREVAARP
jgi:hypothetical protein